MNDAKDFYNNELQAEREWNRMESSLYMKLIYMLHLDFIKENLKDGINILDAGGGSGRYTAEFLKNGYEVSLLDVSDKELEFAKQKHHELGVCANNYFCSDIRDMRQIEDETYDLTLCFGAPLSYCLTNRDVAMNELYRVTKKGGIVAVSVNGTWGVIQSSYGACNVEFFSNPEYWHIFDVVETGDVPPFKEVRQPPRHFFSPEDLTELMKNAGFENIVLGAAPCLSCSNKKEFNELSKNNKAYQTIIDLELRSYRNPYLVGFGEFLMAKAKK